MEVVECEILEDKACSTSTGQPSGRSRVTVPGVGQPVPSSPLAESSAVDIVIDTTKVRNAIDAGAFHAAGAKARDDAIFSDYHSVWPTKVQIAEREAMWMRKELSLVMHSVGVGALPVGIEGFQVSFTKTLDLRRTGGAAGCRTRPSIYNYVVDGAKCYVINFGAPIPMKYISEQGLGSVPCGNPDCVGRSGKWHTTPCRWSHKTAAPCIHLEPNGMPAPVEYAWSTCADCHVPFSHGNPVTLRRLQDVPEVLGMLPFDPEWPFGAISIDRIHTSHLEYDCVTRQGGADLVAKLDKLGSEWVQRRVELYLNHGQVWASQLSALVGDGVYEHLAPARQLELAELRGEFEFFSATPEPLAPLGSGGGRTDAMRWNVPSLTSSVVHEKMLAVQENRRDLREAQMSSVDLTEVLSLDWCAFTGKQLGGSRLANFVNEDTNLVASRVTKTEAMEELVPVLEKLAPRSKVLVVVIDKVPPSIDETAISKLERLIMDKLPTVIKVMQDRFHVGHGLSKFFNNCCAVFTYLIIIEWRNATVVRDTQLEAAVDEGLRAGLIAKTCKGKTIVRGQKLTNEEIAELKESGLYHDLFSSKGRVIVPEHVKDASTLRLSVERWIEMVTDAAFHPADAAGIRHPILINGKRLAASPELVHKQGTNALKRMFNCIPPPGMPDWKDTGKKDANGYIIWKSRFHTCGCESWNGLQTDFVTGGSTGKEMAQSSFLEGNTKRIFAKQVELGQQESLGGVWDVRRAININRLAGHGGEHGMARLTAIRPLAITAPPLKPEGALCIQELGRLDKRAAKHLPTASSLREQSGAPRACPSLPAAILLTVPQPTGLKLAPLTCAESCEDEIDPSQLDSPHSRALLAAAGIEDPNAASPGMLRRALAFTPLATANEASANEASPDVEMAANIATTRAEYLKVAMPQASALMAQAVMGGCEAEGEARSAAAEALTDAFTVRDAQEAADEQMAQVAAATEDPLPAETAVFQATALPVAPAIAHPATVCLQQAGGVKRALQGGHEAAKKKSKSNPWWCTCKAVWPPNPGRQWHQQACPRERFERDGQLPCVGDTVVCMQSSGPRAGQTFRCIRVAKDGWERVLPEATQVEQVVVPAR